MILTLLKNKWVIIGIVIAGLLGALYFTSKKLESTRAELSISRNNEKAYEKGVEVWRDRYGQEHAKSIMFNQTLEDFKNSTDSINQRMYQIIKQQDVKLKKIQQVMYSQQGVDTTIYKPINIPTMPDTTIDLSNEHITNVIKLSPTQVSSRVALETEVLTSFEFKKELVARPKKFFIARWIQNIFGKKHTVIEGETILTNPIIKTKNQRFIKVVD